MRTETNPAPSLPISIAPTTIQCCVQPRILPIPLNFLEGDVDREIERQLTYIRSHEAAIQSHKISIAALKERRNDLQYISRLPNETLEIIFYLCSISEWPTTPWSRQFWPAWTQLTYVCRRWRRVALNYPRLWSNISDKLRGRWALTFVLRASRGPFDVRITLDFHHSQTPLAILAQIDRIRRLEITGSTWQISSFVNQLTKPAPLLEVLIFKLTDGSPPNHCFVLLPNSMFSGHAPNLRRLALGPHLVVQQNLPILAGLYDMETSSGLSASEIRSIMKRTPSLKRFLASGKSSLMLTRPLRFDSKTTIRLPALRTLRIHKTTPEAAYLLHGLRMPSLSNFHLTVPIDSVTAEALHQLAAITASHMRQGAMLERPIRSFALLGHEGGIYTYGWAQCDKGTRSQPSSVENNYFFSFKHCFIAADDRPSPFEDFEMFRATFNHLPLSNVVTLTICAPEYFGSTEWSQLLSPLDRVEQLVLTGDDELLGLLEAASLPLPGSKDAYATFLLPHLKSLVVSTQAIRTLGGTLGASITRLAWVRKEAGLSLKGISFKDCNSFSASLTSQLWDLVKVTWDGEIIEPSIWESLEQSDASDVIGTWMKIFDE
ncbi:hypothetical protein EW146_g8831 [Bondarzewia mesenterica]|uniref:Uncharacterized protein n=1 Tax=Bondarzewia mesenterica TaxID=1095465 RepID=A0A4S4LBD3_9AGAM|nr:hypothetical protein EW146_g8831 [Bondarzewia mesenterica]